MRTGAIALLFFLAAVSAGALGPVGVYYEDTAKAAAAYEKAAEEDAENKKLLYDLASVYKEFGENRKAFESYRRITALNGSEIRAHFELAKMYYFLGALNYAEEELKYLNRRGRVNWEVFYWWGVILTEMKKYDEAEEKLKESIKQDPYKVIAYLKLAELYEKIKDYDSALEYYELTLRKDRTYSEVNRRMAVIYEKKEKFLKAYEYWEKTADVFPRDKEAKEKKKEFAKLIPEVKVKIDALEEEKKQKRYSYLPPEIEPAALAEEIPVIRVGLKRGENRIYFKCGSGFDVLNRNGGVIIKGVKFREYTIEAVGGRGFFSDGDEKYYFKDRVEIKKHNPKSTTAVYDIKYGQGFFWAGKEDTSYRGDFTVLINRMKLTLVNNLNMEEYLYGVIPAEIPAYWPVEALRTQAVAARTYAFKHLNRHEKDYFDVCATQHCAVYKGLLGEHPNTSKAVDDTRGAVLYGSNDRLLSTFFSHSCGGFTQDASEVWGSAPIKSLKGVFDGKGKAPAAPFSPFVLEEWVRTFPETYCRIKGRGETSFRWIRYLNARDLKYYINQRYDIGKIKSIEPVRRAKGGAAAMIEIKGSDGSARVRFDPIRNALGKIRNNVIKWEYRKDKDGYIKDIYIYGAGWGHAVGMCQRGVKGMAESGKGYREILYHYYPGSYIKVKY
ncbi:MAG: SpoIID/LytB domain-containing protein [Candidatus Goldiibacteriota bacterium]